MTITPLTKEERLNSGFTHKAVITYADLNATAATTKTLVLFSYLAGQALRDAAFRLDTPFDGTSTTNLALDFGWNGATTDDADGCLDNLEIHNDATEILYGLCNGAEWATLKTGYVPLDAGDYQVLFTATGANLTDLSAGQITIFFTIADLRSGRF